MWQYLPYFDSAFTQRNECAEEHVQLSAFIWCCYASIKYFYSTASIIKSLYFNPYGILLLPYFHDHSRHSKNKILLQLDDGSLCFLPMYAKLLSKAELHQITATWSSCISKWWEYLYWKSYLRQGPFSQELPAWAATSWVCAWYLVSYFHAQSTAVDLSLLVGSTVLSYVMRDLPPVNATVT